MTEKFSGTSRELVPASLRGFRSWRTDGSRLIAVVRNYTWDVGVNTARCSYDAGLPPCSGWGFPGTAPLGRNQVPNKDCTCGFYACYSFFNSNIPMADIFGSIKASGLVVMGTEGFRAEKVEVEALWSTDRRHKDVADRYGVPFYHRSAVPFIKYSPVDLGAILSEQERKKPYPNITNRLRRMSSRWVRE